jgi:hypothetical protein
MDALSDLLNVVFAQASNTDSPIAGEVDVVFINQLLALFGVQASVGEHANLVGDVIPVAAGKAGKIVTERCAHGMDAVGHSFAVGFPHGIQLSIATDFVYNASTMDGGIRVLRTCEDFQLGGHSVAFIFALAKGSN